MSPIVEYECPHCGAVRDSFPPKKISVTIDTTKQDEEGIIVNVGETMRITVWDADDVDAEGEIARVIEDAIRVYLTVA